MITMITLYPQPIFPKHTVLNTPSFARRNINKKNVQTQMTRQQVRLEAGRILSGGLSLRLWRILDMLATGGALSTRWLPHLAANKMREWCRMRLFERISHDPVEIQSLYIEMGLDEKKPILYMLGPVGVEIAKIRYEVEPPGGYQGYTSMRVMHDVAANEIILRLADLIGGKGWTVDWFGKYESTLVDRSERTILEPDGLIRYRKDGEDGGDGAFLLEYHNEDWQSRAATKVEKYEKAFVECDWRSQWEVETFPPVLVVFLKAIVGTGYRNATRDNNRLNCTYYGKTLKSVLEGNLEEWTNVGMDMKREVILPK
jgi:hypothetical protein